MGAVCLGGAIAAAAEAITTETASARLPAVARRAKAGATTEV
jgi:hypothetical protein